ncbi:hypothetical protein N0V84_001112 [Fusarium piperis]|uniref:Zn(2)-C6 fungal-type domain-containing protein n=1 Tax=Fusarium piperis TaxID=1435070 RepID=A0A9W9BSV9_9HYPO|nr:hypothetical protein N0V84_001112 [Fusarium piperis]
MADLRSACDRCHNKKLRCTKMPGSIVCGRCVKAGVSCIFSPPARSLRQPDNTAFDWSPMLEFDNQTFDALGNVGVNPQTITPPVSDETDSTPPGPVSQLADLMVSLDRLQQDFPSHAQHHVSALQVREISQSLTAKFNLQTTLDNLLQWAQKLSALYPEVLKQLQPQQDTCSIPDCLHMVHGSLRTRPQLPFDQSTVNLLIACHLKLLAIFDNMVDHAHLCAKVTAMLPDDHEPSFDIPEIRIGSFVAPKASAASMMTAMIIELQSTLAERARQLSDLVASTAGNESREAKILGLQCEGLKEHSSTTLADLHELRDHLTKLGFIR